MKPVRGWAHSRPGDRGRHGGGTLTRRIAVAATGSGGIDPVLSPILVHR